MIEPPLIAIKGRWATLVSKVFLARDQLKRKLSGDVLLIIDAINDLEFPGGEKVLPWAEKMAPRLARFRAKAHSAGIPVIYVNDNFGHWKSNFADVFEHCTRRGARGRAVSQRVKPTKDDYFILKPRHSGFFATSLRPLLDNLGAKRLILAPLKRAAPAAFC